MDVFEHRQTVEKKIVNGNIVHFLQEDMINDNGNVIIKGVRDGVPYLLKGMDKKIPNKYTKKVSSVVSASRKRKRTTNKRKGSTNKRKGSTNKRKK